MAYGVTFTLAVFTLGATVGAPMLDARAATGDFDLSLAIACDPDEPPQVREQALQIVFRAAQNAQQRLHAARDAFVAMASNEDDERLRRYAQVYIKNLREED